MDKSANQILDLVIDRIKKYGPPAAIVGGGLAGLSHLIAMKKQHDDEEADVNKPDNTIYLDIPNKKAFDWDRVTDVGSAAAGGAVVGGAVGGATYLIASIIHKLREKKQEDVTDPVDGAEDYGDEEIDPEPKYAGIFDTPSNSQYLLDSGLAVGTTLAGGAIGYKVVNAILQKVRKQREQGELEKTKGEYSKLLSQKIYGMENSNKTASEIEFQNTESLALSIYHSLEEIGEDNVFYKKATTDPTMVSLMTSLPGVGALITGILAHNYWYNKQQDIEAGLAKQESESLKKSPSMIKIRTINPETGEEDKTAGFVESLIAPELAAQQELSHTLSGSIAPAPVAASAHKKQGPVFKESDVENIDPNTVVVSTDDGETQIDAEDPKAVKLLEKYKEIIARSIATGVNINHDTKDKE